MKVSLIKKITIIQRLINGEVFLLPEITFSNGGQLVPKRFGNDIVKRQRNLICQVVMREYRSIVSMSASCIRVNIDNQPKVSGGDVMYLCIGFGSPDSRKCVRQKKPVKFADECLGGSFHRRRITTQQRL